MGHRTDKRCSPGSLAARPGGPGCGLPCDPRPGTREGGHRRKELAELLLDEAGQAAAVAAVRDVPEEGLQGFPDDGVEHGVLAVAGLIRMVGMRHALGERVPGAAALPSDGDTGLAPGGITVPRGNTNGWPRSTELSNVVPFSSHPAEWTFTVSRVEGLVSSMFEAALRARRLRGSRGRESRGRSRPRIAW
jgi:hypothetical protein